MFLLHYRLSYLCKASVGKATNRRSMSHGSYPDFLLYFPRGFLWQVFSGLRSNRTSIVSGCSAPVLLLSSFKLALSTRTIFLYFRFSERLSLSNIMCSLIGYSSNVMDTLACIWGCLVHSSRHPSLTGVLCLCTGVFFVQSCGHPSLTGLTCFVRGFISKVEYAPAYLAGYASYGDFGPKLLIPSLAGLICFVRGFSSQVADTPA